jgi:hypothetical protein
MSKLFEIAGVSRINANAGFKLRVANGKINSRLRVLERNGHVDIELVKLPHPMSKPDILAWFSLDKPSLSAKLVGKAPKAKVSEPKVEASPELSADAKLLLKRAKDAARKREKRAAEKAAREVGLANEQAEIDAEYAIV